MSLNEAFTQYKSAPSDVTRTHLWVELDSYIKTQLKYRYGAHYHDYDDAAGDALVKAWGEIETFELDGPASFATLVSIIVEQKCIDLFRKADSHNEVNLVVAEIEKKPSDYVGHNKPLDLEKWINQLSPIRQMLMTLKLAGYSENAIAKRLNKTQRWVEDNYMESVRKIQQIAGIPTP